MAAKYVATSATAGAILGAAALLGVGTVTGTVAAGDDSRIVGAQQASTLTTRGDLYVRGASTVGRLGLGTSGYLLGSDGTDPSWLSPTTVRGYVEGSRVTTPTLTSSAGWTVTNLVSGTGSISGGAFTVTMPTGVSSGSGATATFATTFSSRWELTGRVTITNDTDGEMLAGLSGVWAAGTLTLYVRGPGSWYLYQGGGWGFAGLTISGSSMPVDGTGWVRLRVDGTRVQAWSGIGSGSTPPTVWTLRADVTWSRPIDYPQPTSLQLIGLSNNSHSIPAGTTVVWQSVTLRDLSLGGS